MLAFITVSFFPSIIAIIIHLMDFSQNAEYETIFYSLKTKKIKNFEIKR